MNTIEKHKNLAHTLRSFLLQEYSKNIWITTDKDTYDYFAKQAFKSAQKVKNAPSKIISTLQGAQSPRSILAALATSKTEQRSFERTLVSPQPNPTPPTAPSPTQPIPPSPPPSQPTPPLPGKTEPTPPPVMETVIRPKTHLEQKQFLRETLQPTGSTNFTDMLTFFKEKLPTIPLSDSIPDDSEAKAIALRWKAPAAQVLLLSFSNLTKEQQFLANIAQAIDQRLASAKIIYAYKVEEEKGWEDLLNANTLRLVISSNTSLHTLPELLKHYREESTGKHTLARVPLFLLADLSLYMEQPALKSSLWKSLCHCLGSK
ncbi:MAG: hypothetical protein H0T62_11295 [Parachlamydiaceae bacterium]|nr:hypothetical protein [Parachlamydiaceae bacterium]